jgi:hypothetical protein
MTTTSSNGKVAYIYDQQTDTWYPIAGTTNTAATFNWSGAHTFGSTVSLNDVVVSKAGVNNFSTSTVRDAVITSPVNGLVAFVQQDGSGNQINQIQYYYNGRWRNYDDSCWFDTKTANYEIVIPDAGKTIRVESSSDLTITVPLNSVTPFIIGQKIEIIRKGSGEVSIAGALGVTINSKNSNKRIATQYSGAVLVKDDTNTWILIGDLKA